MPNAVRQELLLVEEEELGREGGRVRVERW